MENGPRAIVEVPLPPLFGTGQTLYNPVRLLHNVNKVALALQEAAAQLPS
jgi:hypothetical protein